MKSKIDLEKDVTPLSDFRQKTKKYLSRLKDGDHALILTQNGHSAAVVLSPAHFQALEYEREFFKAIATGERDLAEGRTVAHEELFKKLLK